MVEKQLELVYLPVDIGRLWDDNPKLHDLQLLQESIWKYGFRDPPHYSETLGGFSEGNGRTTALWMGKEAGKLPPRGILVSEDGEWLMPVLVGLDFARKVEAEAWALDHNNINFLTVPGMTALDTSRAWDNDRYLAVLQNAVHDSLTVDEDDFLLMKRILEADPNLNTEESTEPDHIAEQASVSNAPSEKPTRNTDLPDKHQYLLDFESSDDLTEFEEFLYSLTEGVAGKKGTLLVQFLIENCL